MALRLPLLRLPALRLSGLLLPALLLPALVVPTGGAAGLARAENGPVDPLTGPRSPLSKDWTGLVAVPAGTEILVMAGHADSQYITGPGTPGEAVGLKGAAPIYRGITDELYWNMVIAQAVVNLGQRRGLTIRYHRPPFRSMANGDEQGTNWSEAQRHGARGGYAMEIHFDAYGPSGVGSGLIPAINRPFNRIDESLAEEFGAYPWAFRGGLGGPRRGLSLLEIGKLEGRLEASLRDPASRDLAVHTIATRVVRALERGMDRTRQPAAAALNAPRRGQAAISRQPDGAGNAPPARRPPASSGAE
jgi:hypothetical protein